MSKRRELALVEQGSPCDINYFDRSLLTVEQAEQRGKELCPNYDECIAHPKNCALRYGLDVAKYVMKGGSLRSELLEFAEQEHTNGIYRNSNDRCDFSLIRGRSQTIKAVERFSRIVLLEDPDKSVLESCPKCNGAKLEAIVVDSGRDGVSPLSGSGRTRRRAVDYCPSCDPKPQGGTFDENGDLNIL
jgi:hypothetical protein